MHSSQRLVLAAAAAVLLSSCAMMNPSTVHFGGEMTGAQEVPPVMTAGTGTYEATLDKNTRVLVYSVTYSGLSGPATAGHFHGPAGPGQNAPVVIPFPNPTNPISGQATLTDAQVADILAGHWYVNVHTREHPGGEIRAQVLPR